METWGSEGEELGTGREGKLAVQPRAELRLVEQVIVWARGLLYGGWRGCVWMWMVTLVSYHNMVWSQIS